jgi:hypothetical protein
MSVNSERRLNRLRELLDQLERLPPSAERERMLREVRGRLVDVDTGVPPRPMMPVDADSAPADDPAARPTRPRAPARGAHADEVRRARALPRPEPAQPDFVASLGPDEMLSLADSVPPAPRPESRPGPTARPWTRGLRG